MGIIKRPDQEMFKYFVLILMLCFGVSFSVDKKISELDTAGAISGSEVFPIVQGGATKKLALSAIISGVKIATANTAASNTSTVIDNVDVDASASVQWGFKILINGSSPNEFAYGEYIITKGSAEDDVTSNLILAMNSDETKLIEPTLSYDSTDNQIDITQQVVASDDGAVEWRVQLDMLTSDAEPSF